MTIVWDGKITADDWRSHLEAIFDDPEWPPGTRNLTDLRSADVSDDHRHRPGRDRDDVRPHLDKIRGMKSAAVAGDNFESSTGVRGASKEPAGPEPHRVQRPAQRVHLARHRQDGRPGHGDRPAQRAPREACRQRRRPSTACLKSGRFASNRSESLYRGQDRGLEADSVAQTEAHLPTTSRRVAARKALLSPVNLIPFPVLAVLALARHYHFVADKPLWLLLGTMVVTQIVHDRDRGRVPAGHDRTPGRACSSPRRSCSSAAACTRTGGARSSRSGFVFAAATTIHSEGSKYALWAMACTVLTVAAGELTDRARLGQDDGAGARRARARAARGCRRVRGDLDPLVQPGREGARRGIAAAERTAIPRARAARLRHHPRRRAPTGP